VGVDPAANTITLANPASGPVRTYNVKTQAGREQLRMGKCTEFTVRLSRTHRGAIDEAAS
jgi:hypothetical protein